MCVSCKVRKSKAELLRIVLLPEGDIVVDPTGKKPGRGAYVCKNDVCIEEARKAHRFDKGLHKPVAADIIEKLKTDVVLLGSKEEIGIGKK
jgi:hypothetical protein